MKVHLDIDCTPAEARSFFGLPDLKPIEDILVNRMKEIAEKGLGSAEVQAMMQQWMTAGLGGMQAMAQLWKSAQAKD